jgi:CRISPR/Cas system-associated exonuclease Cas4 (RecB family)
MDIVHKLLNLPSGSHFARLVTCRASHVMSIEARRVGQIAYEDSEAARQGTRIHEAMHTEDLEKLNSEECEMAADLRQQELELLSEWKRDSTVQERREERLYLRRDGHLFPIFTGQPDLVFVQGNRALIIDRKFGRRQVSTPSENWQLRTYAVLLSQSEPQLEEITVTIQSPYFQYQPVTYTREELGQLYQSVLVVLQSLADPGDPVPGDHCQFCPARLICPAARNEAENAALAKVVELPLGEEAARLLAQIKRARSLFLEVEAFYKRILEETPGAIPGWMLAPGDVRRSIENAGAVYEKVKDLLPLDEFLSACSVSVPQLEKAWAKKSGVPVTRVREPFKKFLGEFLLEKRNAPSLSRVAN